MEHQGLQEQNIDLKIYVIPKNVNARFEFFEGFGFKEIGIVFIAAVIGLFIGWIIWLFSGSTIPFFLCVPTAALGYFVSKPDPRTGMSALNLIKDAKDFGSKQKRYFYRFGSGR